MGTQCSGAKIRKIDIPLPTPVLFLYLKVGYKGLFITRRCFPAGKITFIGEVSRYNFCFTLFSYFKISWNIGGELLSMPFLVNYWGPLNWKSSSHRLRNKNNC